MNAQLPQLTEMLRDVEIDAGEVARAGGGVWAFGSRATGCAKPNSDWDVLLVSINVQKPARVRVGMLDLVYIGLSSFLTDWQQSELATHVDAHGICLSAAYGLTVISQPLAAAPRKKAVVYKRALLIDRLWDAFASRQRRREAIRLRRDVQRVTLLEKGLAIPPSAWLDAEWTESSASERRRVIRSLSLTPRVARAAFFDAVQEVR